MELAKLSKSSMAALTKKVGEIPLQTTVIGAREVEMVEEPIPGPIGETTTVEESKSNCSVLRNDTSKDHKSELRITPIRPAAASEKQHPKPIPTPEKVEVF